MYMCVCYNLHSSPSKYIIPSIRSAVAFIKQFCDFNLVSMYSFATRSLLKVVNLILPVIT